MLRDPLWHLPHLSEPGSTSLSLCIQVFPIGWKLMHHDPQGHHKFVIPKEKCFFLILSTWDCGHRGYLFNTFKYWERFWWLCWMMMWSGSFRLPIPAKTTRPVIFTSTHYSWHSMLFRKVILTHASCNCKQVHYLVQATAHCHPGLSGPSSERSEKTSGTLYLRISFADGWSGWDCYLIMAPCLWLCSYLSEKYGIHHIKISPYTLRPTAWWTQTLWHMWITHEDMQQWAFQMGMQSFCHRPIGYSPYFMAHGVEAVLPLDIAEATYLFPLSMFHFNWGISLHTMPTAPEKTRDLRRCRLGSWRLGQCPIILYVFFIDHPGFRTLKSETCPCAHSSMLKRSLRAQGQVPDFKSRNPGWSMKNTWKNGSWLLPSLQTLADISRRSSGLFWSCWHGVQWDPQLKWEHREGNKVCCSAMSSGRTASTPLPWNYGDNQRPMDSNSAYHLECSLLHLHEWFTYVKVLRSTWPWPEVIREILMWWIIFLGQ